MRHLPQGTKRFVAGFVAAFVAIELPLSAAIVPIRPTVSPAIIDSKIAALPNQTRYDFNTAEVAPSVDISHIAQLEAEFGNQVIQTEKYIPMDMKTGDSGARVAHKILEASIETWFNETDAKNTKVGRSVVAIQNGLSTEIVSKDKNGRVLGTVKLKIEPVRGLTQIIYQGRINAAFGYDVGSSDIQMKLYKNIHGTEYSVGRVQDGGETKDMFNMAWSF